MDTLRQMLLLIKYRETQTEPASISKPIQRNISSVFKPSAAENIWGSEHMHA